MLILDNFLLRTYNYVIFSRFCLLSVKRMKNQDMNIIARTARILDSNPCLRGSLVFSGAFWIPDLTSLTAPHFTKNKYLVSQYSPILPIFCPCARAPSHPMASNAGCFCCRRLFGNTYPTSVLCTIVALTLAVAIIYEPPSVK